MKINKSLIFVLSSLLISSCSKASDINSNDSTFSSSTSSEEDDSSSTFEDEYLNQYDFKDLDYSNNGYITNSYKNNSYNLNIEVNNNQDYKSIDETISYLDKFKENDKNIDVNKFNKYDLSIPNNIKKKDLDKEYNLIFFIHPGAWISGSKDDLTFDNNSLTQILSGNYNFSSTSLISTAIKSMLTDRFISVSMNHTLLVQETGHKELSVYRMLDEIDSCLNSAVNKLVSLGFKKDKINLIMAGGSSGSHLSMLYSYSRKDRMIIKPKAIINVVGPTSLNYKAWRQFTSEDKKLAGGEITPESFSFEETEPLTYDNESYTYINKFNQYQVTRFSNGMAGSIYSDEEIAKLTNDNETIDETSSIAKQFLNTITPSLSPVSFIDENSAPIFSLYGGKDQIIGINQYATLKPILDKYNIKNKLHFEKTFTHFVGLDDADDFSSIAKLINTYQKISEEIKDFLTDLNLLKS